MVWMKRQTYRYSRSLFVYSSLSSLFSSSSFCIIPSFSWTVLEKSVVFSNCSSLFSALNWTFCCLYSFMKKIIALWFFARSLKLSLPVCVLFLSLSSSFWACFNWPSSSTLALWRDWHSLYVSSSDSFSYKSRSDCWLMLGCRFSPALSTERLWGFSPDVRWLCWAGAGAHRFMALGWGVSQDTLIRSVQLPLSR